MTNLSELPNSDRLIHHLKTKAVLLFCEIAPDEFRTFAKEVMHLVIEALDSNQLRITNPELADCNIIQTDSVQNSLDEITASMRTNFITLVLHNRNSHNDEEHPLTTVTSEWINNMHVIRGENEKSKTHHLIIVTADQEGDYDDTVGFGIDEQDNGTGRTYAINVTQRRMVNNIV